MMKKWRFSGSFSSIDQVVDQQLLLYESKEFALG